MKIDINKLTENAKLKRITLHCAGVKKRCRTSENHSFDLGYYSSDTSLEDLVEEAKTRILTDMRSLKPESKAWLSAMNTEIEVQGHMLIQKFGSQDVFNKEKFIL